MNRLMRKFWFWLYRLSARKLGISIALKEPPAEGAKVSGTKCQIKIFKFSDGTTLENHNLCDGRKITCDEAKKMRSDAVLVETETKTHLV